MAQPKFSGLGRGLDSIFVDNAAEPAKGGTLLRVNEIEPRQSQPRKHFDPQALAALAQSIAENGLIQPVAVRATASGFYELIAGERRWRAAKLAGLTEIPAVILETSDQKTAELALIENVQREDLSPLEVAAAYKLLMDSYGMTQEAVAKTVGRSRPAVANSLRLLELPSEVAALVEQGSLSEGHAKVLLSAGDPKLMIVLAKEIVEKGLSVRQTELLVKKTLRDAAKQAEEEEAEQLELPGIDYRLLLEQKATERLGRPLRIVGAGKNKRIELRYEDDEDLEALLSQLCGKDLFREF